MKVTINAVRRKKMQSKFSDSPWTLTEVRIEGKGDEIFQLSGFNSKRVEKLVKGDVLTGYFSTKTNGQYTNKMFNAISPEYVYDLLLRLHPDIESVPGNTAAKEPAKEEGWNDNGTSKDGGFTAGSDGNGSPDFPDEPGF